MNSDGAEGRLTFFASPERASYDSVAEMRRTLNNEKLLIPTLDALPEIMLVLNEQRQIVHLNMALCKALGIGREAEKDICGMRPGELLKCVHADGAPNGCGTSEFCRECGAVNAILECQLKGVQCTRDCRLLSSGGDAMDLRITATPMAIDGKHLCILAVRDISDEKRRQALERIFFHDIANLAGGIQGGSDLLLESSDPEVKPIAEIISLASNQLIDEINAQRELLLAERGELKASIEKIASIPLLEEIASIYRNHEVSALKSIMVSQASEQIPLFSSKPLLSRVIGNMLKNALEATPRGGTVEMSCRRLRETGEVEFSVGNPGYIPKNVQLQLFQRSFSTKGDGRGLGTYSIKLLTERYLNGQVGFSSNPSNGTKFFIRLKTAHP